MRVDVPEYKTFVDFPDGTSPDEIQNVLSTNFPSKVEIDNTLPAVAMPGPDDPEGILSGAFQETKPPTKPSRRDSCGELRNHSSKSRRFSGS
jgi:hypothetical protein